MKKLMCWLGILFMATLLVLPEQAEAFRGHRGYGGRGWHGGYRGHGGFLPGLIIGGVLGWGLRPRYYYPPGYYYPPPPPPYYYPPPPNYYYPPPAEGSQAPPPAGQSPEERMFIYPRQGQSEEKQAEDFNKCHDWAVGRTGFDPAKPPVGDPDTRGDYWRAISACLDAYGYSVR